MTRDEAVAVLEDPVARELLSSPIPARLAYVGRDGTPRVVPMGFHWTGAEIVVCTAVTAPKVAALRASPAVAITVDTETHPPRVLLVRGTVAITVVHGLPAEFLDGARKLVPAATWGEWLTTVTKLYDAMARIAVTPTWAKVMDFETRGPDAVTRLSAERR